MPTLPSYTFETTPKITKSVSHRRKHRLLKDWSGITPYHGTYAASQEQRHPASYLGRPLCTNDRILCSTRISLMPSVRLLPC